MAKFHSRQSDTSVGKSPKGGGLPPFGKALKSIVEAGKQYTILLGLIAGVPGAVVLISARFHVPLPVAIVIGMLPFLLILAWYVAIRHEQRYQARAIELGIHGKIKDANYFRLTPYDADSDFRRADNVHEKVYAWIADSRAPLLYLMGASGSGKSSVISGWVLPKFLREGIQVHVVAARVVGDPVTAVRQALLSPRAIWERPPANGELEFRELLEKAAKRVAPKKLLLVLDQFEEFLILARGEQRDTFTAVLASLASSPVPNLQLLMILREDYRGQLESLELSTPQRDMMTVPKFYESDAIAFLKASELEINSTLESEILEEARKVEQAKGLIRPITINLFGLVLRRFHTLPKEYRGTLLRSYLRELIERPEIRGFAYPILRCMIIGNTKKPAVALTDIASKVGLDPRQVRGCLVELANEGVVRELDRERGIWEISHDFIASLYHPIVEGWQKSFWLRHRPWIIGSLVGIWLAISLSIWTNISGQQEARQRTELLSLGFSNVPCPDLAYEPECRAWAAQGGVDDAALVKAVPHFRSLGSITSLDLSKTKVTDIEPLRGLPGLKMLDLSMTEVSKINALRALPGLESLSLWRDIGIKDFVALESLTALRALDLREVRLRDASDLSKLTHLESLKLGGNRGFQSSDSLSVLTTLRTLDLNETAINNIEALKGLHNLRELYLARNPIKDVGSLSAVQNLKTLVLDETSIKEINVVRNFHLLETLILAKTEINNIEPLANLNRLRTLDLNGTNITRIDALSGLSSLRVLNLQYTKITTLDAIKNLNLEVLGVNPDSIEGIEPLREMKSLKEVHVPYVQKESFSRFEMLPSAKMVMDELY